MEDFSDPIILNAELLLSRAEAALASQDPYYMAQVGAELRGFADNNVGYLEASGRMDLVDQLEAGWGRLTGNQPGTWENPNRYTTDAARMKSPFAAGVKGFAGALVERFNAGTRNLSPLLKWAVVGVGGIAVIKIVNLIRGR